MIVPVVWTFFWDDWDDPDDPDDYMETRLKPESAIHSAETFFRFTSRLHYFFSHPPLHFLFFIFLHPPITIYHFFNGPSLKKKHFESIFKDDV